jgi:hypothetical protein
VATSGNLRKAASSNSYIYNDGYIIRTAVNADAAIAYIEPGTLNTGYGVVSVGDGAKLKFTGSDTAGGVTYSLWSNALNGSVSLGVSGAALYTTNDLYVTAGSLLIANGNAQVTSSQINGTLRMTGGTLSFNSTTGGKPAVGELDITGNFIFGGTAVLKVRIDPTAPGNDTIVEIDRTLAVSLNTLQGDGASIKLYMLNQNAPVNSTWNVFQAANINLGNQGISVSGFDTQGQPLGTWTFSVDRANSLGKVKRTA